MSMELVYKKKGPNIRAFLYLVDPLSFCRDQGLNLKTLPGAWRRFGYNITNNG
jgi:hypothetical protein